MAPRLALLAACLLSGCAAAQPSVQAQAPGALNPPPRQQAEPRTARQGALGAYLVGRIAAGEQDTATSADAFLRALRADPGNPELLTRAFLATLLDGRPEAARLARQSSDNPLAALLLTHAEMRAGRWDRVEARFRNLPRGAATQVLQPLLLAWAQAGRNQPDAALATLRPAIEGGRVRAVYALHGALIADLAGRPAEAARLYRLARAESPGPNLRLAQALASFHARNGRETEAEAAMAEIAASGDDLALSAPLLLAASKAPLVGNATQGVAEAYLGLAAALGPAEAPEVALAMLRLALDLRPDLSPAWLHMADVLARGRHWALAERALSRIPADDPLAPAARLRLAVVTDRQDRTADAVAALERIAADFPDRAEPWVRLGDLLRVRSRFQEAAAAYDRAIARIGPPQRQHWVLFYARAIALERSRNWPRAEADFREALRLNPDQPDVLNYLGYSLADQGRNLEEARRMIERAVELRPEDGAIVDSLGWVLYRMNDIPGAVRWLERAVELQPRDATINDHLGDAYWAAGRRLEAEFQWRRALNLNPEPEEAARIEAKLRERFPAPEPAAAPAPQ
jgi:tetratricopeptide (TPR) repeat protein